MFNFIEESLALKPDARQAEFQKWSQVMIAGLYGFERAEMDRLLVVVVARDRDQPVGTCTGMLAQKCFHSACRAPVAVQERMHRGQVIVHRKGLYQRIVVQVFAPERLA